MATSIFYNGRLIRRPGSYSEVDASGLEAIGLGASGLVALIGTASGGRPVSDMTGPDDFIRITRPGQERSIFRSGDLREAIPIAFAPSNDEEIQAGAQEVLAMKVNPSTQSQAVLQNAQGDAIDLESVDYGAHTAQVNIEVASGTLKGKLITIVFEDVTESVDDLGGDDFFNLTYADTGANGWDTMTAQVVAGGSVQCAATRPGLAGLDGDVGTPLAAPGLIEVVSTAADTNRVTIYGVDGSGNAISETLTLTGTTEVVGTLTYAAAAVLGVRIEGTTTGTVSVEPSGGGAFIFQLTAGANKTAGLHLCEGMFVSGTAVTLVSSGASTQDIILVGLGTTGATLLEKVTLTGAVPVAGVGLFTKLSYIVAGDFEAAQTLTVSAQAAASAPAVQDTMQKLADFFNAKVEGNAGFVFVINTGLLSFDPADLDVTVAAVDCFSPANPGFEANLWTIADWITQNSAYMDGAVSTGATGGAPNNTTTPLFLGGGVEGTASQSDYQTALDLLKRVRVNTLVPLTGDPAVHAICEAHCAYMSGIGRNERDCVVGLRNTALNGLATKTEIKTQIQALNSRHIRAVAQSVERYNVAGERTVFDPTFRAVVAAGMQAGSDVGTSLTNKYENSLNLSQDSSWNPMDDGEEMIAAGLCFAEYVEGRGRRWVRNITTYLTSDNLAYTEASVNEAANYATYEFRTKMEYAVGRKGFAGTINAAKGLAIGKLDALIDEEILVDWRSLDFELLLDVMEVGVEIAPVIPINFVKSTVHLVAIRQVA